MVNISKKAMTKFPKQMNEFATRCNVYVFAVCLHVVFSSSASKIAIFNLSSPTRVCRQFQK